MFSPLPMLQISALVLERDKQAVLRELGRLGSMQLTSTPAGPDTAPLPPRDRGSDSARCEQILSRVAELRRALEIGACPAPPEDMPLDRADDRLRLLEMQAGALLERRQQLLQRQRESAAVGEQMSSFRGLAVPLDQLGRFSFLHFVAGSLPPENLEPLREGVGPNVVLLPMPRRAARQPLIALTSCAGRSSLDHALQQAGFRSEALPALAGATVDTLAETSRRETQAAAAALAQVNVEIQAFAASAAQPLAVIEQQAAMERCLLDAERNFPRTEAAVLLRGWVPADGATVLEQRLKTVTSGRCVIEQAAPAAPGDDQVPVLLRHGRLLRPFAMLVEGYGLPRYRELSPTLFVAITYLLMFGMMFGDVGHGAVLACAGLAMLLARRTALALNIGLLLLLGGLASAAFGAAYGSYFGIERLKPYALWRDPLEGNPMGLMYCAVGFGIFVISLGLVLNCINRFRRGERAGAILDKFGVTGLLFYWGALLLLTMRVPLRAHGLMPAAILLFLVPPLLGWMLKEPLAVILEKHAGRPLTPGRVLLAAAESVVEAFEAVLLYMANTISFVRLAAYAMSHAALLMAITLLAVAADRSLGHGGLPGILVLIAGNAIAIALEAVIASVQALRLQYYEFFGKFFSGSGQPFKPFCLVHLAESQCVLKREVGIGGAA